MELETINKLYLELSQVATAKTAREMELEDMLTSARCIAQRQGVATAWDRFDARIAKAGIGCVTAKTFRDEESFRKGIEETFIKAVSGWGEAHKIDDKLSELERAAAKSSDQNIKALVADLAKILRSKE